MKIMKIGIAVLALAVAGGFARSDSKSVVVTAAGAAAYSDQINISGYLDRVEIVKSSDNDVVDIDLATWSGTTAIDTYVDINALATATDKVVIRPRVVGTDAAGTALTAVVAGDSSALTNNVTTVLAAPYERPLVGGNLKLKLNASAGTNATITATFYWIPVQK